MTTAKAYFKHGHGDDPVIAATDDDVDQLIDALVTESWENSVAAVYVDGRLNSAGVPDHELLVAVDYEDKTRGALRYMGRDGVYLSKGISSEADTVLYYYMGSDREFPRGSLLALDDIRTAVKEFLASGADRPTSIKWQDLNEDIT
ncbi:Imm1 family immunity protein [Kribbella sp. CA-293567]|uniref:Imm1 family immunity protein n=1 Tax=Kribbella sp. CA-293567 TaxID=3002436 RepID=UPI0022DE05C0|nr:Imm1 family immunity protein [Kribbella sp. CA-293567]WBQ03229.1 Imm1 family immunity protein [Kribbella sp. CA-293567]